MFGTADYGGVNQTGSIFENAAGTHVVKEVASVDTDTGYNILA